MHHVQIKITCPTCGFSLTGARKPKPGHWGICLKCGEILIFNDQLVMLVPTLEQFAGLAARSPFMHASLIAAQAAIRKHQQTQQN